MDREPPSEIDRKCITLEDLLSQNPNSASHLTKLSQSECLPLAVVLASSLLQLHATPWLAENWSAESIYFSRLVRRQNSGKLLRPVNLEHPYVMSKIGYSLPSCHTQVRLGVHPYLLALGIMLVELSERRPFSHWVSSSYAIPPENLMDKAKAAWEWFEEEASGNMSSQYATAVKHCLNSSYMGSFLPKRMTLMDEGFRDAVYREVVCRLEKAYIEFTEPINVTTLQLL